MKRKKIHAFTSRLTRWLALALLVTIGCISYVVFHVVADAITDIECSHRMNELDFTNERISGLLNSVELAAKNHDVLIEESIGKPQELEERLCDIVNDNPQIIGVSLAFTDRYFPQKGHWYELYARRDSSGISIEQIGSEHHDYLKAEWFTKGLKADKTNGYWSDAYYDESGAHDLLTTFSLPIHDKNGKTIAVLGTDISLRQLQQRLHESDDRNYKNWWLAGNDETTDKEKEKRIKGKYAPYSFIIQRNGTYLVHPDSKRLITKNFYQEIATSKDTLDDKLIESIKRGERSYLKDKERNALKITIDGKESYTFYGPVELTGWTTIIVAPARIIDLASYLVGGVVCFVMIIGMIVSLVVCHIVVRRSTKPLKLLANFAGKVAEGNFSTPLPSIKKHDEFRLLRDSFEDMQHSLAKYMEELRETTAKTASIESELNIAHAIQMAMLPKQFPPYPERKDIDIYGELTPAKAVGGDLFDFYLRDEQLFFCIGDVSGKGVPASLVMAVTRSLFRHISAHQSSPEEIARGINETIAEGNETCMFVTLFIGVLDLKSGLLRYCNAGHDAPLLVGQGVGTLPCDSNVPAGIMAGWDFILQEATIERQTTIFLFTDGLNEAEDSQHNQFGIDRVLAVAESQLSNHQHEPQSLISAMTTAVHDFVGDAEQSDDLTMLAIQLK